MENLHVLNNLLILLQLFLDSILVWTSHLPPFLSPFPSALIFNSSFYTACVPFLCSSQEARRSRTGGVICNCNILVLALPWLSLFSPGDYLVRMEKKQRQGNTEISLPAESSDFGCLEANCYVFSFGMPKHFG